MHLMPPEFRYSADRSKKTKKNYKKLTKQEIQDILIKTN